MKILIYFFSCLTLVVLVGCQKSPEEMCFDAQMDLATSMQRWANYEEIERKTFKALAWQRCMKDS